MPSITGFISTSCEDCKSSLQHVNDLQFCRDLLNACELVKGQKTRISIIKSRIRQLEKGVLMKAKFSERDTRGMLFVDCSECDRGGNGTAVDKCASGWKHKKGRKGGCFMGTLLANLEVA